MTSQFTYFTMLFIQFSLREALSGSPSGLMHTLVVGSLSYLGLIVWLRVSGKRTLSKWNAFDFAVTIAIGSILASSLLSDKTSLAQIMLSFGILVVFQFVITWMSVRFSAFEDIIKAGPTLLFFRGEFLEDALKSKRITKGEVLSAIRVNGIACLEEVDAVVLENEGSFSVIQNLDVNNATAMRDVSGFKTQIAKISS